MNKISLYWCFLFLPLILNFSEANDEKVGNIYELKKGNFSVKLTNYGATVLSVVLPDKNGKLDDVVLGFESLKDYTNDSVYFGATVGRVANRIGRAEFTLNGNHYKLVPNDHGKNTLHGGSKGFSDVLWTVKRHIVDSHITFSYDSRDGEEGFPGDLSVSVTYMFIEPHALAIKMEAKALTKATPVNLAHHTYWNLRGHASGDILSHKIHIFGSNITPVNDELIPTGDIAPVKGTPYDFLEAQEIGSRINELPDGYDINYVLDPSSPEHLRKAAVLHDSVSGRKLELWTNQPGVQFYTSNMLDDVKGKGGFVYKKNAAVCLETQGFPDSVNHPNFPSQIVNPGDTYLHAMVYRNILITTPKRMKRQMSCVFGRHLKSTQWAKIALLQPIHYTAFVKHMRARHACGFTPYQNFIQTYHALLFATFNFHPRLKHLFYC